MKIYEIPYSLSDIFEQGENSYRIIDYSIRGMDNIESMEYFLDMVGIPRDYVVEDYGTQIILSHPEYTHNLVIDSGGLGDFYSHGYSVTICQK